MFQPASGQRQHGDDVGHHLFGLGDDSASDDLAVQRRHLPGYIDEIPGANGFRKGTPLPAGGQVCGFVAGDPVSGI